MIYTEVITWENTVAINKKLEQTLNHLEPLSQIILQASCNTSEVSLALDDVHIIRDKSCDEMIPTTTSAPATTTTPAPASPMDCTFEQGDAGKIRVSVKFVMS